MSGGSFDYLYAKDIDDSGFQSSLSEMIDSMKENGYHEIANHLEKITILMDKAYEKKIVLQTIMHDYEWYISCDYGKDQWEKSMHDYLANFQPEEIIALNVLTKEIASLQKQLEEKRKQLIDKLL